MLNIHKTLVDKGFRALIAGGAVRDLLLERRPNDIDLATDATPDQVEELFEKTVMVGKQFGVSRVIVQGHDIEVATFRKDGAYQDGRKPESVEFCSEKEDALRRDFTINGMFYDPLKSEVIDFVGGQSDLMKKTIRTIGEASLRFSEDKLRVLRALRFHAQLEFSLDPKTLEAIRKHAVQIHQVSQERVRDEWDKVLLAPAAILAFQKIYDTGLWGPLFDTWKFQPLQYKKHWSLPILDSDKAWILWFLIHWPNSIEKMTEEALRWKLPKRLIKKMIYCAQSMAQLKMLSQVEPVDIAIFLNKTNSRLAVEIFKKLHQGQIKESWYEKMKQAENYFEAGQLPELLVNGDDLIQFGIAPGPKIAQGLKSLYRIQIKEKIDHKESLMKYLPQLA